MKDRVSSYYLITVVCTKMAIFRRQTPEIKSAIPMRCFIKIIIWDSLGQAFSNNPLYKEYAVQNFVPTNGKMTIPL